MNHDPSKSYELFVSKLVGSYTEHPDLLRVSARERAGTVSIVITPAPTDFGKVLGKQRKTLTALEILLVCKANLEGDRIAVQLIEPTNRVPAGRGPEVLNGSWTDSDDTDISTLILYVLDQCFRISATIETKPMMNETMFTLVVDRQDSLRDEVIAALHTIFRAVGAVRGRRMVVNARHS